MGFSAPDLFSRLSYLVIETNSSCNLSCLSCNRERLKNEGQRDFKNISLAEFSRMLEVFKDCPLSTIKLQGLSEPMLHPRFAHLASHLRLSFPQAQIIIATNGQYDFAHSPFKDTIDWVDQVYLSLDGVGETLGQLRPGATFSRMLATLEGIFELSAEQRAKIFFNVTVTDSNVFELPQIYDLQKKYGLQGVRLNLAQNWNEDEANPCSFSAELIAFLRSYRADIKGVAGWEYKNCFWPHEGMVVDVFGNVRQCIINTSQKPLTHIFAEDFRHFFNEGAYYQEVRQELAANRGPKSCTHCDYRFLSPLLSEILGGTMVQNKPRPFGVMDVTTGAH